VITFDDGYKNVFTCAYPILRKYHVPATIFLTTGHTETDNPFWWDKVNHIIKDTTLTRLELEEAGEYSLTTPNQRLKARRAITKCLEGLPEERKSQLIQRMETLAGGSLPALNETATLSWNQIEEMSHHDITFGSHTATHPILTRISPEQANHEIYRSKKDIEEHLGKPVNLFSYPNGERGDFNNDIKQLLKDNGFIGAVSSIPGTNTTGTDPYELRRFSNVGGGLDIFKLEISGIVPHFVPALLTGKM
jgi:peptidoglycan/xylan/chitin deacetylase (PgdA/CDA1 family)